MYVLWLATFLYRLREPGTYWKRGTGNVLLTRHLLVPISEYLIIGMYRLRNPIVYLLSPRFTSSNKRFSMWSKWASLKWNFEVISWKKKIFQFWEQSFDWKNPWKCTKIRVKFGVQCSFCKNTCCYCCIITKSALDFIEQIKLHKEKVVKGNQVSMFDYVETSRNLFDDG